MGEKILVAYASRYGSTREVAEAAGATLREHGIEAEVKPAKDVDALGECDGVVIATPFYIGSMLKDTTQFLERNRSELQERPVALLACGPVNADDDMGEARKQIDQALEKVPWLQPVAAEMFVGKYDADHLRFADKLVAVLPASPLYRVPTHDDRDWDSIREWTEALPGVMGLT